MKTNGCSIIVILVLLTYWLGLCNASAFYDPGTQRWLNRDPMTSLDHSFGGDLERNCYMFVGNAPPAFIDPNGLWVWWGNWGGPDWTAGNPTTWENVVDQNLKQKPAQDAQDSCYEAHDKCYAQSRDNFRAAPAER